MPTVAEVVARTLVEYGTEKFFCFMGGDHDLWYALHDAGIQIINCRSEAGAVYMPAQQSGTPMTYQLNGKQYIVVAVSGGAYSGELLAFKLPD